MKLMKARDIMKNMMNEEFQHFVQSQLIEVNGNHFRKNQSPHRTRGRPKKRVA
jgi:hypothetical protein